MATTVIDPLNRPIEIAPGRGDLRTSSLPFSAYDRGYASLIGGRTVSYADLFASQPLVAMTVMRLLTWSARVPLKAYERTGDDSRERLRAGDPLADALLEPWDRAAPMQLVQALLGPLLVHGNATVRLDDGARGRFRFAPADYRFARPIMPWRDTISGWDFDVDDPQVTQTRAADEVLHAAWWSPLGPLGVSPLKQLGTTIAVDDAAVRHQQAMWRNGVRSPTVIEAGVEYAGQSEEFQTLMMEQLREDVDGIYAGPDNSGRPLLLPPGLAAKPMGYTAVEAQLVEQRAVLKDEAYSVYQLQAPGQAASGDVVAELRQNGYLDGLAPPLLLIEAAMNAQVVRSLLREPSKYLEFDFGGLLRGDKLKEIQALREAISISLMTPNEGRGTLNLPRSTDDGMDDHWMPRNNLVKISQPYQGTPSGGPP
jgi:HK97 family phage portal protein